MNLCNITLPQDGKAGGATGTTQGSSVYFKLNLSCNGSRLWTIPRLELTYHKSVPVIFKTWTFQVGLNENSKAPSFKETNHGMIMMTSTVKGQKS